MKQLRINEALDLHRLFEAYRSRDGLGWFFRGQADSSWPLVPKAGRHEFNNGRDLGRFKHWCERAVAHRDLPESIWEKLMVAQHYGLATRLLDWTFNPLVATFFAVAEMPDHDGAVFAYFPALFIDQSEEAIERIDTVAALIPRAIDAWVLRQAAGFTVHPDPSTPLRAGELAQPLSGPSLVQIVIPSDVKPEVRQMLENYGVNFHGLFPDLDGLSRHVNWGTSEMVRRLRASK
ncbi:MAG: FRG domain-containing protein [Hyphomonadaceae bacterium]